MRTRKNGFPWMLAAAIMLSGSETALANPPGYSFARIAVLGDSTPGGGTFVNDFEPSSIQNNGDIAFVADVSTGGEGVFLVRNGHISQLARSGNPAPGGGMFMFSAGGELGRVGFNQSGDAVFGFTLDPLSFPLGLNSGIYRFSRNNQVLSALVIPNATPAPGGGTPGS